MSERTKSLTRETVTREARTALRAVLDREPTAAEIRYLSLGDFALGDKAFLRVQVENALKNLALLRRSRRELLQEMRKARQEMRKLRAQSLAQMSRKKKR